MVICIMTMLVFFLRCPYDNAVAEGIYCPYLFSFIRDLILSAIKSSVKINAVNYKILDILYVRLEKEELYES